MARGKKFTAEQIIGKLREAEVELSRGKSVSSNCMKCRKPLRLRLLGLKSRKTEPQRCVDSIPAT